MALPSKSPGDFTPSGEYTNANFNDQINPLYSWGQGEVDVHIAASTAHDATGGVVGVSKVATLTNKTLTTPVVAAIYQDAAKTKLMTLPDCASDTIAVLGAAQVFTNKTLTAPVLNGGSWYGTINGAWTAAGQTCADAGILSTVDINGGSADGVTLGAAVPAPGTFSDGAHYGVPLLFTKTIVLPEYVEDEAAIVPLMLVQSSWAPYGIRITRVGMMKNANGAYAIMLEKWTYADPPAAEQDILTGDLATGAGASVIETANTFTGTGTYYDVPVNKIVGLDLPSTTGVKTLTVWFTYELKAS
jgi:hypothetical protein